MILDEESGVMYSTAHDFKVIQWCLRTRDILGVFRTQGKYNQTLALLKQTETLFVGDDNGSLCRVSIHSFRRKPLKRKP